MKDGRRKARRKEGGKTLRLPCTPTGTSWEQGFSETSQQVPDWVWAEFRMLPGHRSSSGGKKFEGFYGSMFLRRRSQDVGMAPQFL